MPSQRNAIHAANAPAPNGNYSHAVLSGSTLHIAGWMGDDPVTGKIVAGGIEAQTVCKYPLPLIPMFLQK
jgi:2-iminobutanoate/2-iminopropanoate deaminase